MNIVLTGGTSGLGYRTAQVLGKEIKNKIILIGSNKQKGETSVRNLIKETSNNNISFIQCDLSSISEIKLLADKLKKFKILSIFLKCMKFIYSCSFSDVFFKVNIKKWGIGFCTKINIFNWVIMSPS